MFVILHLLCMFLKISILLSSKLLSLLPFLSSLHMSVSKLKLVFFYSLIHYHNPTLQLSSKSDLFLHLSVACFSAVNSRTCQLLNSSSTLLPRVVPVFMYLHYGLDLAWRADVQSSRLKKHCCRHLLLQMVYKEKVEFWLGWIFWLTNCRKCGA